MLSLAMMDICVLPALDNFCDLKGQLPDQARQVRIDRRSISVSPRSISPGSLPRALRLLRPDRTPDRSRGPAAGSPSLPQDHPGGTRQLVGERDHHGVAVRPLLKPREPPTQAGVPFAVEVQPRGLGPTTSRRRR